MHWRAENESRQFAASDTLVDPGSHIVCEVGVEEMVEVTDGDRRELDRYLERVSKRYAVKFVILKGPEIVDWTDDDGDWRTHNCKATIAPECCRVPIRLKYRSGRWGRSN